MSDWTISQTRPGYREKTIQRGAATIVIYRPVLNNAEQVKREKRTREALESVMRDKLHRRTTT